MRPRCVRSGAGAPRGALALQGPCLPARRFDGRRRAARGHPPAEWGVDLRSHRRRGPGPRHGRGPDGAATRRRPPGRGVHTHPGPRPGLRRGARRVRAGGLQPWLRRRGAGDCRRGRGGGAGTACRGGSDLCLAAGGGAARVGHCRGGRSVRRAVSLPNPAVACGRDAFWAGAVCPCAQWLLHGHLGQPAPQRALARRPGCGAPSGPAPVRGIVASQR